MCEYKYMSNFSLVLSYVFVVVTKGERMDVDVRGARVIRYMYILYIHTQRNILSQQK